MNDNQLWGSPVWPNNSAGTLPLQTWETLLGWLRTETIEPTTRPNPKPVPKQWADNGFWHVIAPCLWVG